MTGVARLLVPTEDGDRVLARPNGLAGWSLPAMAIEGDGVVWDAAMQVAAERALGTQVWPVRRLDRLVWLVEAVGRVPRPGNHRVAAHDVARLGVDAGAAHTYFTETDDEVGPHLRRGARLALESWTDCQVERTGPLELVRHWELGTTARVPTTDGEVAVKVCAPGFRREPGVVAALAGLSGAPVLVAQDTDRLMTRWAGDRARDRSAVARAMGRLQHGSIGRLGALAAAGCRPVRDVLGDLLDEVPDVSAALVAVEALGLPDTVIHTDAHLGNAAGDPPTLIDWSDAEVGSPVLDLPHITGVVDPDAEVVADAVLAWSHGFDPTVLGAAEPAMLAAAVVEALPAIRIVSAAISLAAHRRLRPHLPALFHASWDEDGDFWADQLVTLTRR